MQKPRKNLRAASRDERGIASIMVTMILMVVISLVVLGFAQIARRNQRQVLDRQLSTQAFYAAESGVNDAQNLIQNDIKNGTAITAKTTCTDTGGGVYSGLNSVLASNVSYTCLTVNPNPSTLAYTSVGSDSTIVPLLTTSPSIGNLTLKWTSKIATPSANCPGSVASAFSPTAAWKCGYGVLRIDLVPVSGGSLTASNLAAQTMTTFLVPHAGGVATPLNYANNQSAAATKLRTVVCDDTNCSVVLGNLSGQQYYMRVSSIYQDVSLSISGSVPLSGALASIDSTGKAADVLRRIQVYVPLSGSSQNLLPDSAIESTDSICKRFSVMNGYYKSGVPTSLSATNKLCQP